MGLDRIYVERALADLARWTTYLRGLGPLDPRELDIDLTRQLAVLHALQLAIQLCLDVGAHLLAGIGSAPVEEYSSVGPHLAVGGIVAPELGARLSQMARFRNILVHQYRAIDLDIVVKNLTSGLSDFDEFARSVLLYLERPPPGTDAGGPA